MSNSFLLSKVRNFFNFLIIVSLAMPVKVAFAGGDNDPLTPWELVKRGPSFIPLTSDSPVLPTDAHVFSDPDTRPFQSSSKRKLGLVLRAQKHDVEAFYQLGALERDQGRFSLALDWIILGLGSSFVQQESCMGFDDPGFTELQNLEAAINRVVSSRKPAGKGKRKKSKQTRAERSKAKVIQGIKRDIRFILKKGFLRCMVRNATKGPLRLQIDTFNFLSSFCRSSNPTRKLNVDMEIACRAFMGMASTKLASLVFFAVDLRYINDVTSRHEPYLYELEKRYLRKVNSSNEYYDRGFFYYKFLREAVPKTPADKLLSEDTCVERAAYLLQYDSSPDAHITMARLYRYGRLGKELSQAESMKRMEEEYIAAEKAAPDSHGKASCIYELGIAYLGLSNALTFSRAKDMELVAKGIEYMEKGRDMEKDLVVLPELALAYGFMGREKEAEEESLRVNTVMSITNLVAMYAKNLVGKKLSVKERASKIEALLNRVPKGSPKTLRQGAAGFEDNTRDNPFYIQTLIETYHFFPEYKSSLSPEIRISVIWRLCEKYFSIVGQKAHPSIYAIAARTAFQVNNIEDATKYALIAKATGMPIDDLLADLMAHQDQAAAAKLDAKKAKQRMKTKARKQSSKTPTHTPVDKANLPLAMPAVTPDNSLSEGVDDVTETTSSTSDASTSFEEDDAGKSEADSPKQLPRRERKALKKARKAERDRLRIMQSHFAGGTRFSTSNTKDGPRWNISRGEDIIASFRTDDDKRKVRGLFDDILEQPWGLHGRGQPEILKHWNSSHGVVVYSRRLSKYDRLTYLLDSSTETVHPLTWRGHYPGLEEAIALHIKSH